MNMSEKRKIMRNAFRIMHKYFVNACKSTILNSGGHPEIMRFKAVL
jgi:hypothetical protein